MQNFPFLTEFIEIEAQTDFFQAVPPDLKQTARINFDRTPVYTTMLVENLPELAFYNTVLGLGLQQPVTETDLDRLINLYQKAKLNFSIRLNPFAQPKNLASWLEERSIYPEAGSFSVKLYHTLENLPAPITDFEIKPVTTENITDFVKIACNGISPKLELWLGATIGRENWQHFLAYKSGIPAASGSLFTQNALGWIGWAATSPQFRRQGAQTALLNYRLHKAAQTGCRVVCSDTGKPTAEKPNSSYSNMLKAGFKLSHSRQKYVYQAN